MREKNSLSNKGIVLFVLLTALSFCSYYGITYASQMESAGSAKMIPPIKKYHIELNPKMGIKEQMQSANTIYEVQDVINLEGQTIPIPEGCTLCFNGGCITNGTLEGNLTQIQGTAANIFGITLYLTGTWDINRVDVRWFGALGDNSASSQILKDDAAAINHALAQSQRISPWGQSVPVYLAPATYKISKAINVLYGTQLIGESPRNSLSMPSTRLIRYGQAKGNDSEDCVVNISDQTIIKNVALKCMSKGYVLNGINIAGTSEIELDNISIVNSHYGINKTFKKGGEGFTNTHMSNIKISKCVRGVSVSDYGTLTRKKKGIITWMNHVFFSNIEINDVYECGLYFDVISLFDENTIEGLSIANVGNGLFYPGNYFHNYSDSYITGVYTSVYDDNNIGLLSIQNCYLENIYCTKSIDWKPINGKYLLDSFDYDKNPCICVNNINLSVRNTHFQNGLVLLTSLGKDNILMESCTDGEFYRGEKDNRRIYLCCENPQTNLWLRSFNINNTQRKDCIKKNILSSSIRSIKLQNVSLGSEDVILQDIELSCFNGKIKSTNSTVYVSERTKGSGVWPTYPMSITEIPENIKYSGNLLFSPSLDEENEFETITSADIIKALRNRHINK